MGHQKVQFLGHQCLEDDTIHTQFVQAYCQWILSTKVNTIVGLDNFNTKAYSNGTTETFDKFYLKNKDRRIRCFKGEYMYHQVAGRNYFPNWKFIDDEELKENDEALKFYLKAFLNAFIFVIELYTRF